MIRNVKESTSYTNLSFEYPVILRGGEDVLRSMFDGIFTDFGNQRLSCQIQRVGGKLTVQIESGMYMRVVNDTPEFPEKEDKKKTAAKGAGCSENGDPEAPGSGKKEKRFLLADMLEPLRAMQELRLISRLEDGITGKKCSIGFCCCNSALKDVLENAGNILEAKVYYESRRTMYFDAVPNFSFLWSNSSVSNELDVILTHGTTVLFCSCKTSKYDKSHLYEIKYLAERFSLNTKAVIIYSSEQETDDDGQISLRTEAFLTRAKEMGVSLIDKKTLNCGLGEALMRIAEGTAD